MTKFRLIVYYEDDAAFQDLVELAVKHELSFTRNIEQKVIIFFVESNDVLINISLDIKSMFE